jgi:hypothetical protein
MATTSPAFTPVEASLYLTLCGRRRRRLGRLLAQDVVVSLLDRLSAHLAGGELAFNAYTQVAQFPPVLRLVTRLAALSTGLSRRGTVILRYRF